MKRFVILITALCMCVAMMSPAMAADLEAIGNEQAMVYAYMNLEIADEVTQEKIVAARDELIHKESWVADGLNGYITHADGTIENLPEFHDVFPDDWDVPVSEPVAMLANEVNVTPQATGTWEHYATKYPNLTYPTDGVNTTPFINIPTLGFPNTSSMYFIDSIRTKGIDNSGGDGHFNLGYTNETTGSSLGWAAALDSGSTLTIDAPYNATVSVRASAYDAAAVNSWTMIISVIYS